MRHKASDSEQEAELVSERIRATKGSASRRQCHVIAFLVS